MILMEAAATSNGCGQAVPLKTQSKAAYVAFFADQMAPEKQILVSRIQGTGGNFGGFRSLGVFWTSLPNQKVKTSEVSGKC